MRRKPKNEDAGPGQDSFLDVIANLVGILIVLVMVIGARAKDAWVETSDLPNQQELTELKKAIRTTQNATSAVEADLQATDRKIKMQAAAVAARRAERDRLQLAVTAAEHTLAEQRQRLSRDDRETLQLQSRLSQSRSRLEELINQRGAVQNSLAQTTVIQHIPTPMAKTVFGEEIHFRLLAGRLAFVPLNELVERMKDEVQVKFERLRNTSSTTETVGPIAGFHLRYALQRSEKVQQTQYGSISQSVGEFVGFYLIPESEDLGEPFREAMQPGSQFNRMISGLNPDTVTVTVWVYPDSFDEFLILKKLLFERGFLTASWPLPSGQPIAGSPQGRRSSAQ